MTSKRWIVLGLSGLVIVAGASLAWLWLTPATPRIDPDDGAQVTQGQAVYAAQCARCHGANLQGQPIWRQRQANGRLPAPPHDQSGHSWHHPDSALFDITKRGIAAYAPPGYESDMPAFEGVLTDDEIAAVLAYIKSRWPPEVRARQARIEEQANP